MVYIPNSLLKPLKSHSSTMLNMFKAKYAQILKPNILQMWAHFEATHQAKLHKLTKNNKKSTKMEKIVATQVQTQWMLFPFPIKNFPLENHRGHQSIHESTQQPTHHHMLSFLVAYVWWKALHTNNDVHILQCIVNGSLNLWMYILRGHEAVICIKYINT